MNAKEGPKIGLSTLLRVTARTIYRYGGRIKDLPRYELGVLRHWRMTTRILLKVNL